MTVATFLLLVYGLLLALLAGSIVVTTGRRLTARRRLRLVSSRRRDGGWPPLPWPLPPPPAPPSPPDRMDFLHRTDAETWARENPRTAEATGVIALLAQRDALRARVAALEAERDAAVEQCASAERALNQAWQERDALRAALVLLVGVDGREALDAMADAIRSAVGAAVDKAAALNAIAALLATLPKEADRG